MTERSMSMDFLVRIDTTAFYELPEEQRSEVRDREWVRGRELHEQGILRRLWRLPGQKGNVGLWSARDGDELAQALESLPIWPYATVEATALAHHPLFDAIEGRTDDVGLTATPGTD
ncbi:MAG TPA: muconolactone Delta-isomerase family protein [Luteimicrobium sp.]|nr:muconolactone Delta-isomerase family protein [Luteimicrobium sp.]